MMNNKKVKKPKKMKYPNGGLFSKKNMFNLGQAAGNYGKMMADTSLGMLGLSDIIDDNDYKGNTSKMFSDISNINNMLGNTVIPMAANIVAPGSGQIIKGIQGIGNQTENMFKFGGDINNIVPELEKEEVFQTPQGMIGQVNAPTHEQGGVDINLPNNTRVFSDTLKSSKGKTFAQEAEKFKTDKWQKILDNKVSSEFSKNTAKLMIEKANRRLDSLFKEQETFKKKNNLNDDGTKNKFPLGGTVNPINSSFEQDQNNWINSMDNNEFPVYPYSRNSLDVMNYALNTPGLLENSITPEQQAYQNSLDNTNYPTPNTSAPSSELGKRYNPFKSYLDKTKNFLNKQDPNFILSEAGNFIGPAYDIYRGLKGGDDVNFDRINPNYVDYQNSRDLVNRNINQAFNNTKESVKSAVGGNSGAYLSNIGNMSYNRDKQIGDYMTQSYENQINVNSQIANQAKGQNAQIQMQESVAKQQEKDIASNTLSTGLYNLGSATNMLGTDLQLKGNEPLIKQLISTQTYNYEYDNRGKIIGIKNLETGKVTKFKK